MSGTTRSSPEPQLRKAFTIDDSVENPHEGTLPTLALALGEQTEKTAAKHPELIDVGDAVQDPHRQEHAKCSRLKSTFEAIIVLQRLWIMFCYVSIAYNAWIAVRNFEQRLRA